MLSQNKRSKANRNQAKLSHAKWSQAKLSQAKWIHAKPNQGKRCQAKPSHFKPNNAKPNLAKPSEAKQSKTMRSHAKLETWISHLGIIKNINKMIKISPSWRDTLKHGFLWLAEIAFSGGQNADNLLTRCLVVLNPGFHDSAKIEFSSLQNG